MRNNYWDEYYSVSKKSPPMCPSQFAAFIASELIGTDQFIVDLGCGNGRDTLFFSRYGYRVVGIDASNQAILGCQERRRDDDGAIFVRADLSDTSLLAEVKNIVADYPVILYARFFLHAISDDEEEHFFNFAQLLCKNSGLIAVEFRTDKDEALAKVTDTHFRRFIDPMKFIERALTYGYAPQYFSEGFGYAKFRKDDAHVARMVLRSKENILV